MKKNILHKQNGFTLVELLIAGLIATIFLAGVVRFSQTAFSVKDTVMNEANAVNQVKNAFNYISQDAQMAGWITTDNSHFPLTFSWIEYPAKQVTVIYSIVNGKLQRYFNGPDPNTGEIITKTDNVASDVNPNVTLTNCVWSNEDPLITPKENRLTINLTISKGSVNLSRQFIITPRVISIASAKISTTIKGSSSPEPSRFGQVVTLTAIVNPSVASGVVIFLDNGNPIYPSPIVNGVASYPINNLTVNTHTITAQYSGDANYLSSTSPGWTQRVYKADTTTKLEQSVNPSYKGQDVIFTATVSVTPPGAGTLGGTVQFNIDGTDFGGPVDVSGDSPVSITSGAISTLELGDHTIIVVYSGDGNFSGSTDSLVHQISKYLTTCVLSSSLNPSTPGQSVTFTANVSVVPVVPPASGTPTGTVTFYHEAAILGTGTLNASGQATCETTALLAGIHTITAEYSGDANFAPPATPPNLTQKVIGPPDAAKSTLTPTSSSIPASGISTQRLTVQAKDTSGTSLTTGGATVTITKLSGDGSISGVTDNGNGTYTADVTSSTTPFTSGVFVATLNGNPVMNGGSSQTQATVNYIEGNTINVVTNMPWSAITTGTGPGGQPSGADTINVYGGATLTVDVPKTPILAGQAYAIKLSDDTKGTGTLTFQSGGTVTVGNLTIGGSRNGTVNMTAGGSLKINGSVTLGSSYTFTPGTGTVTYGGPAAQTILTALSYNNLATSGSGNKTMDGPVPVNNLNNLTVGGATTLTLGGATIVNGSLSIGAGTILDVSTSSPAVTVNGSWTNNGTFTPRSGRVTLGGTDQSITGATTFNNLTLSGSGTKTLGGAITVNGNLSIGSGTTLNAGSNQMTVAGSWTNSGTFNPGSGTVILNGTSAQTIPAATPFYHLTLSGSGTKTLSSATAVGGNLTIGASTTFDVTTNNYALTVNGNWTNSGTFNPRGGTVTLSGTVTQTMMGATTFNNLILNNGAGLTINNNETITTLLTLTAGKITTGSSNAVILSYGSGTIQNSNTTKYIVGNLQKVVAKGNNVSVTFEVGTATGYEPVTVRFTTVNNAGNLTVGAKSGQHNPWPAFGQMSQTHYVTLYWTLTNSGISFDNYRVTFTYVNPGDFISGFDTTTCIIGQYNTSWIFPAGTYTRTTTTVRLTGFTILPGDFVIGNPSGF